VRVCVYCASSERIDALYRRLATEVGARIAADGHSLVSGGGRVSMMGDVARAARAGGAHTLGVMPQSLVDTEIADVEADELLVVASMRERKRLMDDNADAFLALPGGVGTLEELFEVWTSSYLGMHSKPVIVLDPFGFYEPLWAWLTSLRETGFVSERALAGLHRAKSVDEAFHLLA